LKAPDEKVRLKELELGKTSLSMILQLEKLPNQINQTYEFLSWTAKDNNNQDLQRERDGRGSSENYDYVEYDYEYTFDDPLQGPVRFEISDYPNRIEKAFEVQILP
jgi:hypothetical protein